MLRQEGRGHRREILVVELGGGVHAPHRGVIDGAFEALQRLPGLRQALRQIRAVEQHRVVAGKVLAVVGKHGQSVLVDLGVGRVNVDRVDLALGDSFVGEAVIEAAGRRIRQVVRKLQSGPTVGPADEFLRQSQSQLGVCFQFGQARDAFGAGVVAAHRQRVGVVEAQRHRDRQAHRRKPRVELRQRRHGVELENLPRDRACVLGVDVDAAGR
jgi:hypothetical protein